MAKVQIDTSPVADQYSHGNEKIIGFVFPSGNGGLISFHADQDRVEVYRADKGVMVLPDRREEAITALYDAADKEDMTSDLDGLMIAAGLRWRCEDPARGLACGGINKIDDTECDLCGEPKPS